MSEKANRSLSQALNSGVRKYGSAIVSNLAIAIKTSQLYSFAHQNVVQALKELEEYLVSFIRLETEAELSRVDEFLFINEVRIRVDLGGMQTYDFVVDLLKAREIGKVTFCDGVTREEIAILIDILTKPASPERPWQQLEEHLGKADLPSIRIEKYEAHSDAPQDITDDKRLLAINLFFRANQQMKDTFDTVRNGRKINLKRLKRTIQAMVDTVLDDEPTLLALVNIKDFGSRLANHATNVAILSIALGARLGFSKKLLGDLGISALLHDIGKANVPAELLERAPDSLSDGDRTAIEDHVYEGVEILLNQRIVDAVVKSMNVAFLHHFRHDNTGFPRTHVVKAQNFYSRIIAVCDRYDNSSAPTPGGAKPKPADEIMRELMDGAGTEFDPLIVKAFVSLLGLYPVGCIVTLDDGSVGTVIAPAANSRYLDRPTVHLFNDGSDAPINVTVCLMDREGGAFKRSILKLFQQEEVQLELDEYLSVI